MRLRFPPGVQFTLCALAWGASFLFIKVGLEGLAPGQVALARLLFGAITLVIVCAVMRKRMPRELSTWGHFVVLGVTSCLVPFLLYAWAEQHISSGLASILNATTPLMTMLLAMVALPSEPRTWQRVCGILIGFLGVVVLVAPWAGFGHAELPAQLACLGATTCYGISFIYLRRFVLPLKLPAVTIACGQVGMAAALMLALTPMLATGPMTLNWRVVGSMLALGMVGTGLAYVWNTNVVQAWGPTNASTVTYVAPVVGVVLGVLLLGERLTWSEPVGAVLVILGIAITQGRIRLRRQTPAATSTGRHPSS